MNDFLHRLLKFVDHNRYQAIAITFAVAILATVTACQPKADSPFDQTRVNESQLIAQAKAYQVELDAKIKGSELTYQSAMAKVQADYEASLVELGSQAKGKELMAQAALDEIAAKKAALQAGIEAIATVGTNMAGPTYAPMIGSALGIAGLLLGIGVAADNRRKDSVILNIKSGRDSDTVI